MITPNEENTIIEFAKKYRNQTKKINNLTNDLEELKTNIHNSLEDLNSNRVEEKIFLDEIKTKYSLDDQEIFKLIQKIVVEHE